MKLNRVNISYYFLIILLLFPVIISFFFKLLGVYVPSYLLISIILICLSLIVAQSKNTRFYKKKSQLTISIYIFLSYVILSSSYSLSEIAMEQKRLFFIYSTIVPILLIDFYYKGFEIKKFNFTDFRHKCSRVSFYLLLLTFLLFLLGFRDVNFPLKRWTLLGSGNPIWFGRFIGLLMITILTDYKSRKRTIGMLGILLGFFLMYQSGSRGPFISMVITMVVFYADKISKKKLALIISFFAVIGFVVYSNFGDRFFGSNDYSTLHRLSLIEQLISFDITKFNGFGLGSYNIIVNGVDELYYPHNILLEILFEFGVFGIFLFFWAGFNFVKNFKSNLLGLLVIFYFCNSLVSGDITSNNSLFITIFAFSILTRKKNDFSLHSHI